MKRRSSLVVALLLTLLMFSGVSASEQPKDDMISVISSQGLVPATNSEVLLGEITVSKLSNGRQRVQGHARIPTTGQDAFQLQVEIDPDDGTYTVTKLEKSGDVRSALADPDSPVLDAGVQPMAQHHYGGIIIYTKDPGNITLARTTTYLHWTEYANGIVEYFTREKAAWAANPSPLNTHWYIDSTIWGGSPGYGPVLAWSNKHYASYWNEDFLKWPEFTYVDHEAQIWGGPGYYDVQWDWEHTGFLKSILKIDHETNP